MAYFRGRVGGGGGGGGVSLSEFYGIFLVYYLRITF